MRWFLQLGDAPLCLRQILALFELLSQFLIVRERFGLSSGPDQRFSQVVVNGVAAAAYDEAVCSATKRILGTCTTDYRQAIGQLSGGRSRAAGIPRVSGADVLAELVAHMPEGSMPLLDDVEVTTTAIRVKGTAENFGKVDEIVAALRKDKCFGEIKQPRTEKARDGSKVVFSLDFPYTCSGEAPGGA